MHQTQPLTSLEYRERFELQFPVRKNNWEIDLKSTRSEQLLRMTCMHDYTTIRRKYTLLLPDTTVHSYYQQNNNNNRKSNFNFDLLKSKLEMLQDEADDGDADSVVGNAIPPSNSRYIVAFRHSFAFAREDTLFTKTIYFPI